MSRHAFVLLATLLVLCTGCRTGRANLDPAARRSALEVRARWVAERLLVVADRAAALPEAVAPDGAGLALFEALGSLDPAIDGEPVAVAVHGTDGSVLAWAGRVSDLTGLLAVTGQTRGVSALAGPASVSLVATSPIRDAAGAVRRLATAEVLAQRHRRTGGSASPELDLLARDGPGARVVYIDARRAGQARVIAGDVVLLAGPDGSPVALARFEEGAIIGARRGVGGRRDPPGPVLLLVAFTIAGALGASILSRAARAAPAVPHPARLLPALALWPLLLLAVAAVHADVITRAPGLAEASLDPLWTPQAATRLALAALQTAALLTAAGLAARAGPAPGTRRGRTAVFAAFALSGLAAAALGRPSGVGLPWLLLVLLTAALPLLSWQATRLARGSGPAGLAFMVALVVLVTHQPTLAHYAEASRAAAVEHDLAPQVLELPRARERALAEACRRLDAVEASGLTAPHDLEELVFTLWDRSGLGLRGFASAVEIEGEDGRSGRFALELPRLAASVPSATSAREAGWVFSRERMAIASLERGVLHARRRTRSPALPRATLHVSVAEDFSGLPFLDPGRSHPRLAPPNAARRFRVELLVWDPAGLTVHGSPTPIPAVAPARTPGVWTTLTVGRRPHDVYVFGDGRHLYGLGVAHHGLHRRTADAVDGAAALALTAAPLLLVAGLPLARRRGARLSFAAVAAAVRRRLALRLFVILVSATVLPLCVLALLGRRAVAERLREEWRRESVELAVTARRVVEDYAFFQGGTAGARPPVADDVLVWVASLVGNELDVFVGGRLLASSERELYASGLVRPRIDGATYSTLVFEGAPSAFVGDRAASERAPSVAVPLALGPRAPAILSLPLAARQREAEETLAELDRLLRLAALGSLILAALLARAASRRISAPLRELTRAARQIADGSPGPRVEARSDDELSELVDAFNQMARDLERQGREIERTHRLAAWTEMARQVAHEVKNPLTPIQLSAEHLRRVFREGHADFERTLEACTATILRQVAALRRMVAEFTAFTRPAGRRRPEDLAAVVSGVLRPYLVALPPEITLELEPPPPLPPLEIDRRQVEHAVLNLVENALQAVGERGRIRIGLEVRPAAVELVVEDNGPGLDVEARRHLFEPFFSTKTTGSGLGLALVRKIADEHGGGVLVEDAPGGGTRARVWFPIVPGGARGEPF